MKITTKKVSELKPYENNARTHSQEQLQQIANSIKEFGFTNPLLIDGNNGIIAGHGRLEAAKLLQMETVPCIVLDYLTEAQKRALIIADNKIALNAGWDKELLELEISALEEVDFNIDLLGFEDSEMLEIKQFKQRENMVSRFDLKEAFKINRIKDFNYFTFFNKSADGYALEDIKTEEFIPTFVNEFILHIRGILSGELSGWAILTTPKRSSKKEFHFMTEVSKEVSKELKISFYEDRIITRNMSRLEPKFSLSETIKETNIILLDDVITTGKTIEASKALLKNKNILCFVAIKNMGLPVVPTYIDFDSDLEDKISIDSTEVTKEDMEKAENDNLINNVKKFYTFTCPNCLSGFEVKHTELEKLVKGDQ
jgi:hypoxanthine phosphoribosyltransferase